MHLANRKGYTDANLISSQTVANSYKIVDQVNSTLCVHIPESVEILKGKKKELEAALVGVSSLAERDGVKGLMRNRALY